MSIWKVTCPGTLRTREPLQYKNIMQGVRRCFSSCTTREKNNDRHTHWSLVQWLNNFIISADSTTYRCTSRMSLKSSAHCELRTAYGLGGECVIWTDIKAGGPLPCKFWSFKHRQIPDYSLCSVSISHTNRIIEHTNKMGDAAVQNLAGT